MMGCGVARHQSNVVRYLHSGSGIHGTVGKRKPRSTEGKGEPQERGFQGNYSRDRLQLLDLERMIILDIEPCNTR